MKLLVITGSFFPRMSNNANLMGKIIPYLSLRHTVQLLAPAFGQREDKLPETMFGVPIHWVTDRKASIKRKYYSIRFSSYEDGGYTGALGAKLISDVAIEIRKSFHYDAVIATMQPYSAAYALLDIPNVKRYIYLMDPPNYSLDIQKKPDSQKHMVDILNAQDGIFTTPFIKEALEKKQQTQIVDKILEVSFPHIQESKLITTSQDIVMDKERINLLFCGALYPSVRDPSYFLQVLKRVDDRFCITFVGRNCDTFWEEAMVKTAADVRALPPVPYQTAINAMEQADVLINIGNNMKVHMPSKTLDYINTGKPIVNFHKFSDCPTLFYTQRYPLCLNLYEKEPITEETVDSFIDFCVKTRLTRIAHSEIERIYSESTPQRIAKIISDRI